MNVPPYFLLRPPMPSDAETLQAFDALFASGEKSGGQEIVYNLAAPRWQFLCYLAESKDVVLHGSCNPDIDLFEPRLANDVSEFGAQNAIYAASDGIWPMYFAILDKVRYKITLVNGCFRVGDLASNPHYFFSISRPALEQQQFCEGMVYLLPGATFRQQPPLPSEFGDIYIQQWASPVAVEPLAKLRVTAEDFPFLSMLRGHDDETLWARVKANPNGFPWIED